MPTRTTGLLRWLTEHKYGGPTRNFTSLPTPGTTAARLVNNKPDRVGLMFSNTGTVTVFIAPEGGASANIGIPLPPNSVFFTNQDQDDTLPSEGWFGVTTAGVGQLYTIEIISDTIVSPEER